MYQPPSKHLRVLLIALGLAVPMTGCADVVPSAGEDGDGDGLGTFVAMDPDAPGDGGSNCGEDSEMGDSEEPCPTLPPTDDLDRAENLAEPFRGVSLAEGSEASCELPVDSEESVCAVCVSDHCTAGTSASCQPWPASPLVAAECEAADEGLPTCLAGWTALGDARIETGRLVPGGDLEAEAGFIMNAPSDVLVDAIELVATFAASEGCEGACELDTVGVGLLDSQEVPTDELSGALPTRVALVYRAAAKEVIVRIAGDVVVRLPFDEARPVWALRALPDGTAVVLSGPEATRLSPVAVSAELRFEPSASMKAVVLGRTFNPNGTQTSAGITEFMRRDLACDTLDVWTEPAAITAPMPTDGAPGLALDGDEVNFVVATEAGISLLSNDAQVRSTIEGEDLTNPSHLFIDGKHRVYVTQANSETLYFEADTLDGPWSEGFVVLGAADADEDAFSLSRSTTGIIEATAAEHPSGPIIVAVEARGGKRSLVGFQHRSPISGGAHAAAGRADTETVYEPIFSVDDAGDEHHLGNLNMLLGRIGGAEVANPSLIQYQGGWHLYVSLRFGSRVHTHLFTSAELLNWEHRGRVIGGERLEDEFGASGFDAATIGGDVVGVYVGRSQVSERLLLVNRTFDGMFR